MDQVPCRFLGVSSTGCPGLPGQGALLWRTVDQYDRHLLNRGGSQQAVLGCVLLSLKLFPGVANSADDLD